MRRTRFGAAVFARLTARANPTVKANYDRYFKGAAQFLGLKSPAIRQVVREVETLLRNRPIAGVLDESFRLLQSPWAEEKYVGVALIGRNARRLPVGFLRDFEPVFDRSVHDWGTCDHVASRVLRPLIVARDADLRRVVQWRQARSSWRQRAAAVAFVNEARHGHYDRQIMTVCRSLVRNRDRFVQLGMGWVLRELSLADRGAVLKFLHRHRRDMNRDALRYATEKMPTKVREQALEAQLAVARS
jgi:3-methyladenine DNA glycosylase AlkD